MNYDDRETRTSDARAAEIATQLPALIAHAQTHSTAAAKQLAGVDANTITDTAALASLPVLRKSEIVALQSQSAPLGGLEGVALHNIDHLFQSPGPIYEMGMRSHDWFRLGRFLTAAGVGQADRVQNCFSYHLTPAGMMFESGAKAVGATVLPAGIGQTEQQATAAAHLGITTYAGTPDFLKVILEKADELGVSLSALNKAVVSGGALFPSLRSYYQSRGIDCLQCYATAELGLIAYESQADAGMIVDEDVIVEIVTPGTGNPVADGEVGEVLVTLLSNHDYPLIRFATGDLSAWMDGVSECGRTNRRIKGWMGRADQTAKIKGMFVRPEQVAALVAKFECVSRARVEITRENEQDQMTVKLETSDQSIESTAKAAVQELMKVRGEVVLCTPDSLPKDGKVIDDLRVYD